MSEGNLTGNAAAGLQDSWLPPPVGPPPSNLCASPQVPSLGDEERQNREERGMGGRVGFGEGRGERGPPPYRPR